MDAPNTDEPTAVAPTAEQARAQVEGVARASYGRLVAILAASHGDIAAAEDAIADAFVSALDTWPTRGIPPNPTGWIITVARNRLKDLWKSAPRRTAVSLAAVDAVAERRAAETVAAIESLPGDTDADSIPDKRLALLFVCAHPAIDAAIRTPLMLQTVLGFPSADIARAFAVPEATMAQRLVRAKHRIRDARIPFAVPDRTVMRERLPAVLEAVYGTYAIYGVAGAGPSAGARPGAGESTLSGGWAEASDSMAGEALYLAVTLAELIVDEPEAWGLAALIALSMARAPARRRPDGTLVVLTDQDTRLWDVDLIDRGETALRRAHHLGSVGRFQLEAAIQSAHCDRRRTGTTEWVAVRRLSEALVRCAPTLGARVALASTIAETDGPTEALDYLDRLDDTDQFQPAWATRGYLLGLLLRPQEAMAAYARAIELTTDPALRRALEREKQRL